MKIITIQNKLNKIQLGYKDFKKYIHLKNHEIIFCKGNNRDIYKQFIQFVLNI